MSTTDQKQIIEKKDMRSSKGKVIAVSRMVYRIINTDVFYVESESKDGMYYYVMFDTAKNFEWCSCKSFEYHNQKCKHLFGVEEAIKKGVVKDVEKLPNKTKRENQQIVMEYENDKYDF